MKIELKSPFLPEVRAFLEDLSSDRRYADCQKTLSKLVLKLSISSNNSIFTDCEINILKYCARVMIEDCFDDKALIRSCRNFLIQIGFYVRAKPGEIRVFRYLNKNYVLNKD